MRITFFLLILFITLTACHRREKNFEPISFTYKTIYLRSDSADSTGPYFEIKARVAYAQGTLAKSINDSIMQIFLTNTEMDIPCFPDGLDTLAHIMKETFEEDFGVTTNYHAYYNIDTEVVKTSDSTVCYKAYLSCYLGGAHDSHMTFLLNFNTKTARQIQLDDIVPNHLKDSLTTLIVNDLARQYEKTSLEGLREISIFEMHGPEPAKNYIITPDTLTFIYNEYEIAPYCMGSFVVKIPRW